ncbi:DUF3846 domain-containing protein [Rhodococcus hoagii]|nr:DUF3846 domain-containing protein [Prescottella equi]MBM4654019.1 DUF3846 domain-containing protein [Prescottella equi]MBM4719720.1 DUF3846 domain-containing protein [Prescottella equi]NKR23515.1 DUF3846 domain-containing protein [Prescottella equi]NKT56331.1 DUF3846 domain-containing protein [Prescottella equi]
MTNAIVITPSGEVREVDLGTDSLRGLYAAIGCSAVEVVQLAADLDMWVDEEGLLTSEPQPNRVASQFAFECGTSPVTYVGSAVFTGRRGGDTTSIPEAWRSKLLALA